MEIRGGRIRFGRAELQMASGDPVVDKEHRDRVVSEYMGQLREIEVTTQKNNGGSDTLDTRLNSIRAELAKLRRRRAFFTDLLNRKSLAKRTPESVLREVCHRLATLERVPTNPNELLEAVLSPYLRSRKGGTPVGK